LAITLKLRVEQGQLVVRFDDQTVTTPAGNIPAIARLQADPFTNEQALTAALGGVEMLKRLTDDPDNLILLDCDEPADAFAWEFATLPDRQFLCVKAGMLRTVPRDAPPAGGNCALNFIALAADPLVDERGKVRDGYRLDLDNEMRAIRETLQNSGKNLTASRIPPTREHLNRALRQGPAVLHLTCHGTVVNTPNGPLAVLSLENQDGSHDALTGADLLNMAPRGVLRMVLLSSCMTATGSQANLARALALNGVPIAIGMQESFPDPLSDELAVALYDSLFSGLGMGEALRQARMSLMREPRSVGLPVGYVSANGWREAFPIQPGMPSVGGLGKPGFASLGGEIQPPRPLLGRNLELHQIANHFMQGRRVITVAGTGGMGKTALAAAFAERFAWLWPQGVRGVSFANEVNAANFQYALMRVLFGEEGAQKGAGLSEGQQREAILGAAREWNGLWLFDNYESVMQVKDENGDAEAIHRLVADLANGDAAMLLTSREQPAGLRNELLYPEGSHALHGLGAEAGVEMFFQHSVKAKETRKAHIQFALDIQHAADGHPLAIALLAGEYDVSAVTMEAFLKDWQGELANARRTGLAGHHATFTIAFERSFSRLPPDLQAKLALLSIFSFPFFAEGARFLWQNFSPPAGGDEGAVERQGLDELARRSLLEVEGRFEDDTPATYRFQPALRQEAARRLEAGLHEGQQNGYAAYSSWFVNIAFAERRKEPPIVRLALSSLGELVKNANHQPSDKAARYCWQLGTVLYQLGFTLEADEILKKGAAIAQVHGDDVRRERILFQQARMNILRGNLEAALNELNECARLAKSENNDGEYSVILSETANIHLTRGDLDRALALYQESLQLLEQLGDKQGKAASLHQMAQVFLTRGDLDRALALYQESLQLKEQLGDKQGKAASLHQMAQVFLTRGDLDRALALYQESLQLDEQLGDKKGKAASLHQMAQVFLTRGDLDRALALYQESLQLDEQLGDKKGKAASLHQMAQVFLTRGDLDRALALYQESLQLDEQLGDKQGKAASLSQMSDIFVQRRNLDEAERLLLQSLDIGKQLQHIDGVAFRTVKLGQISQLRGDKETALSRYREGLAIFERMGMPEAQQVRQMIADLEGGAFPSPEGQGEGNPLAQAIAQARNAAQRGDVPSAIEFQEQAVKLARERTSPPTPLLEGERSERDALVTLGVTLYNLAGFYGKADRFDAAVKAMEEVVAIDLQTGHEDLESDRQRLEAFRRMASMTPEERAQLQQRAQEEHASPDGEDGLEAQLQAQLAGLPPEKRAEAEAQIRKALEEFQRMTPGEQAALMDQGRRAQIESAADQARDAGLAYVRSQAPKKDILDFLNGMAQKAAEGEVPGSPWLEVAALCIALTALIQGEAIPPVPAAYAPHFSAVQGEMKK